MNEHLQKLRALIHTIQPLPDNDWNAMSAIWSPFSAKRKEILTRAGETEKYLYFVLDGVQRVYFEDDQSHEATIVFTYPPSFSGVLDSMLMHQPSRYNFETLTPSEFLRTPIATLLRLADNHLQIAKMMQTGLIGTLSGVLSRMVELQSFSAEERFRNLLKRSPHILQLVPHKYLANYIGVDASNFSKMINKIKI
ncbi:MAG: Crp/Fnr family transcriptional regulator [Bacteroidota bacterium]